MRAMLKRNILHIMYYDGIFNNTQKRTPFYLQHQRQLKPQKKKMKQRNFIPLFFIYMKIINTISRYLMIRFLFFCLVKKTKKFVCQFFVIVLFCGKFVVNDFHLINDFEWQETTSYVLLHSREWMNILKSTENWKHSF